MLPSIHTKAIRKTTRLNLLNLGETSHSINGKTLKDTEETTKIFPLNGYLVQWVDRVPCHHLP